MYPSSMIRSNNPVFSFFEVALVIVSLVSHVADICTDLIVTVQYAVDGQTLWAVLSGSLVLIPSVIVQLFSIRWYYIDGNIDKTKLLMHICLLGPIYRYMCVLREGLATRRKTTADEAVAALYSSQNDVCMLRLIEAFLESGPQVLLQLYIITCTKDNNCFTAASALISLISLAWAVVAYSNALRQAHQPTYIVSCTGLVLIFLWRVSMIASRLLILLLFASSFHAWTGVALGVRWLFMFVWLLTQKTSFCTTQWEERLFNMVVAVIHLFMFLNMSDGQTRYRALVYYTWSVAECSILYGLWCGLSEVKEYHPAEAAGIIYGLFFFGLAFMMVYYRFFHPTGRIYLFVKHDRSVQTADTNIQPKSQNTELPDLHLAHKAEPYPADQYVSNSLKGYLHDQSLI